MQSILQGLLIIARHDPNAEIAAEHDQIWCGDTRQINLTAEEAEEMDDLGWRVDERNRSWTRFT